jgi:hypothetical protein
MFVENNGTCILGPLPDLLIRPGITLVPDAKWDEAAKTEFGQFYLKAKKLVPLEVTRGKEDLKGLDQEQAITIAKRLTDHKLIKNLRRTEKRMDVLDALEARLAEITPKQPARED